VTSSGDAFNMGYVQGGLVATEPNTLTMQYDNGDICHKGTDNESHRSTRMIFYCSSRHELPVVVEKEDNCQYVIEWQTPFACPVQHAVGDDCKVEDPLYHITFDLNEMTKAGDSDYVVSSEDGRQNFTLNICAALRTRKDDGCAGDSGACVGQGNTAINFGNYNKRLEYEDGQLKLVYVDGNETCNGKRNRTTTILFTCDHVKRGAIGLSYLRTKSSDCNHWFQWQTSLACLPFSQAACSITDSKGNTFNLEPATMTDDNYEVEVNEFPSGPVKFIINICTTLVHRKGVLCPPNSAACMISLNETDPKKRYMSVGNLANQILSFEDDHLIITYEGGDACSNGGQPSKTIIRVDCLPEAVDFDPEYITTEPGCVHRFVWSNQYGCVLNNTQTPSGDCSVKDPLSGHLYNLSALRNDIEANFVSDAQYNHDYNLSVCWPLPNSPCGPNAGSCQTEKDGAKRSFNAGEVNADVVFLSSGLLSLTYSNGIVCHHNKKSRSTTINFICASGVGKGKPEFVGEDPDGCSYIFSWHTDLACDREVGWNC
jgi:insulin-like growth factor 2 receptor